MGARCCNHSHQNPAQDRAYRRVLWVVLLINAAMFGVETVAGLLADSLSLHADALDFLGDAANYGISLFVVGMAVRHRAMATLAKGATMAGFGLWVIGSTAFHFLSGTVPEALTMGKVGVAALLANLASFALLWAYRDGDSNMRSVWICSRNDVMGNLAVLAAAAGVFGTGRGWPDSIVAVLMASLALQGAFSVLRSALRELRSDPEAETIRGVPRFVLRWLGSVALLLVASSTLSAETVHLTGQITCCEDCWNSTDRTKVPFGTTEDLAASAGCIANGEIPLLAVSRDGKTVMYALAEGRFRFDELNWLDYVGAKAELSGELRHQKNKPSVRVDALKILEPSLAVQESQRALGSAPPLTLPDLAGVEQSIASRRGRIVVLNFWGTFCPPCVKEIPELAAIQSEYAALGVEVIGATADTMADRAKVISFVREFGVNFPVWLGATAGDMRRFGLGEALPATVILDREGKVVWQKRGVIERSELKQKIESLLTGALTAVAPEERTEEPVRIASASPKEQEASLVPS